MEQILYFLLTNHDAIFLAMFASLAVVAFVNFVHNPYTSQNVKLKRFSKRTLQKPSSIVWETKCLPEEYQRQWRAFVNSGCAKPSVVFEFVKRPQKYLLWFAHFVALVLCVPYFVLALMLNNQEFFATQVAFVLFSALIVLLKKIVALINLSHARRVFGRFLHSLNVVVDIAKGDKFHAQTTSNGQNFVAESCQTLPQPTPNQTFVPNATPYGTTIIADNTTPQTPAPTSTKGQTIAQIDSADGATQSPKPSADALQAQPHCDGENLSQICKNRGDVIEKTVQILQQKGLDNPRTVEEQRKLNIALNNLLQACCKK